MRMISAARALVKRIVTGWNIKARPDEGDWTRWIVQSASRPDDPNAEHLVDLLDYRIEGNGFNGSCTCEDFQFNLKPALDAKENGGVPLRCKHIKRARSLAVDAMLEIEWQKRNWMKGDKRWRYRKQTA